MDQKPEEFKKTMELIKYMLETEKFYYENPNRQIFLFYYNDKLFAIVKTNSGIFLEFKYPHIFDGIKYDSTNPMTLKFSLSIVVTNNGDLLVEDAHLAFWKFLNVVNMELEEDYKFNSIDNFNDLLEYEIVKLS